MSRHWLIDLCTSLACWKTCLFMSRGWPHWFTLITNVRKAMQGKTHLKPRKCSVSCYRNRNIPAEPSFMQEETRRSCLFRAYSFSSELACTWAWMLQLAQTILNKYLGVNPCCAQPVLFNGFNPKSLLSFFVWFHFLCLWQSTSRFFSLKVILRIAKTKILLFLSWRKGNRTIFRQLLWFEAAQNGLDKTLSATQHEKQMHSWPFRWTLSPTASPEDQNPLKNKNNFPKCPKGRLLRPFSQLHSAVDNGHGWLRWKHFVCSGQPRWSEKNKMQPVFFLFTRLLETRKGCWQMKFNL